VHAAVMQGTARNRRTPSRRHACSCRAAAFCAHSPTSPHRMYEDRFGTEDDPVIVPSLEPERIIGVTDPDDDNLVVWGVLRESDPPRQFIEGGEFYVLRKVRRGGGTEGEEG
jgi:hypothetical protein